jgi:predicted SAM-dependent methyltransferase
METLVRLDLGCGDVPKEGFEGVDMYGTGAKHKVDLMSFPWPFKDSSVDEINCSHFIEHLPMYPLVNGDTDMLIAFMNECYRILKPGANMTVVCPSARSNRAFWDPTHRRFIVSETFLYFSKEWRELNKLEHYLHATCNFGVNVGHSVPAEMNLLSPEASARRFNESWNVVFDCIATLKSLKSVTPPPA